MTTTSAAPAGMLHSDHINYLILRYLQESGHENAAEALYREWHRSSEYRDPESYPFARAVKRRELVSIVQQGLVHDELKASVGKRSRQFRFTIATSGDDAGDQGSREGSRPLSRGYKNGTLTMRAPDEFPTPAPKRQRRSEGSESAHVNGNMMDVDSKSNASVDGDEDQDMPFPAPVSETEEIIERYDSMEIGTQTEVKDIKTSSISWTIDKPGSSVLCNLWNPDASSSRNALTLLTVGESLSRLHQLPESFDGVEPLSHNDDGKIDSNSSVTAAAWHPDGQSFVCAFDTLRSLPDGSPLQELAIVDHSIEKGNLIYPQGPRKLDPPGVITRIRYSPKGDYLLALQTNLDASLLSVWKTTTVSEEEHETFGEPYAWKFFDSALVDAVWTQHVDDNDMETLAIATCGVATMKWWVPGNEPSMHNDDLPDSRGLELCRVGETFEEKTTKILYDYASRILIRIVQEDESDSLKVSWNSPRSAKTLSSALLGEPTDIAVRPLLDLEADVRLSSSVQSLLAVAYQEGYCAVYRLSDIPSAGEDNLRATSSYMQRQADCWLPSGPALVAAISPKGSYVAVANTDTLGIWAVDTLTRHAVDLPEDERIRKSGVTRTSQPSIVSWTRPTATGTADGESNVDDIPQPILAWNADGQAVALSVGNEVNVIRFRPSIQQDSKTNGVLPSNGAGVADSLSNGH
nr:hypothetical protein CFP56_60285 [Quercus suber]